MTWHTPQEAPQNPDNLESALADLKNQLAQVKADIDQGLVSRDELLSGNNKILKDKLVELDLRAAEIDEMRVKASEHLTSNVEKFDILNAEITKHQSNVQAHEEQKLKFAGEVKQMAQDLDIRQQALSDKEALHAQIKIDLDEQHDRLTKLLDLSAQKKKELNEMQVSIQQAFTQSTDAEDKHRATVEELKELEKRILVLRAANDKDLIDAKAERLSAQEALNKNLDTLASIEKAKAANTDLIIESKRQASQAVEKIKILQRKEIEINEKMAELKSLKEELSK